MGFSNREYFSAPELNAYSNDSCQSTFSNIFSETTEPIELNFSYGDSLGCENASNGHVQMVLGLGHMTMMAASHIYGKVSGETL